MVDREGNGLVEMLGVGGDVGYGGCEPRIEGIVQCTKRYCTILRKLKICVGGLGVGAIFESKTLSIYLKKKKRIKKKSIQTNNNYSKNHMIFFNFHQIIFSLYSTSC